MLYCLRQRSLLSNSRVALGKNNPEIRLLASILIRERVAVPIATTFCTLKFKSRFDVEERGFGSTPGSAGQKPKNTKCAFPSTNWPTSLIYLESWVVPRFKVSKLEHCAPYMDHSPIEITMRIGREGGCKNNKVHTRVHQQRQETQETGVRWGRVGGNRALSERNKLCRRPSRFCPHAASVHPRLETNESLCAGTSGAC